MRGGSPGWWIGWYTRVDVGSRVGLALIVVAGIVGGLWLASVGSRHRFRAVAPAGALVLASTAVGCWWMADRTARPPVAPALVMVSTAVVAIQTILVIGLVITVWVLRSVDEPARGSEWRPFLGGWLAPLVSLIAVLLGGLLSAATTLAVARLFGQPSGVRLAPRRPPSATLFVPDEAFALALGTVATLPALLIVALVLWRSYRRKVHRFSHGDDQVRGWYPGPGHAPDDAVAKVARAWALASLTDRVGALVIRVGGQRRALCLVELLGGAGRCSCQSGPRRVPRVDQEG